MKTHLFALSVGLVLCIPLLADEKTSESITYVNLQPKRHRGDELLPRVRACHGRIDRKVDATACVTFE